ncbi:MAG: hypothetical protein ACHP7N_04360 [Caulobacterales bacterium]
MTINKDDAAQALGEIEAAQGRVRQITAYAYSAPFFIIWGVVWLVADTAWQFAPRLYFIWPPAALIGAVACTVVGFTQPPKDYASRSPSRWRSFATAIALALFLVALFCVITPATMRQMHSAIGLLVGFSYIIGGLWVGGRILALGLVMVALTLIGYFALTTWYPLFMAVVGGGALLLGGFWLRKI